MRWKRYSLSIPSRSVLQLWQRSVFDVSTAFGCYPFLVPIMDQSWRVICIVEFEAAGFIRILNYIDVACLHLLFMDAEQQSPIRNDFCPLLSGFKVLHMDFGRRNRRPRLVHAK